MATVSEIQFWPNGKIAEFPVCHRIRPLGKMNLVDDEGPERCIDCCFGPPMEYWDYCPECGSLEVFPEAYCYECEKKEKETANG